MTNAHLDELLAQLQTEQVVDVCRHLVQTMSVNPPGDELAIATYVAGFLNEAGLEVELLPHDPRRASVVARLKGSGEVPNVLYSGHLDTVPVGDQPWQHDPFSGDVIDGKLWGRGSSDMKGGLAAMMVAAHLLARAQAPLRGDLILAATAGEEVNSLGAEAVARDVDLGPVGVLVVAEPSANQVFVAQKGALWLQLTTFGQTAHGSMPDLGRNAVVMMMALLQGVQNLDVPYVADPLLDGFTRSINTIAGGMKTNVVPDRCTATIDMRTVPGQDHQAIVAQVEGLISDLRRQMPGFEASLEVLNDRTPITTPPDDPAVQRFLDVVADVTGARPAPKGVRYYTDAGALYPVTHAPVIVCGPGEAEMAHQPDEYVPVDQLVTSVRILARAAARFLG